MLIKTKKLSTKGGTSQRLNVTQIVTHLKKKIKLKKSSYIDNILSLFKLLNDSDIIILIFS
jgi:hypothetical protein